MKGVRFVGDALAPSGYGNALRDLAKVFHDLSIPFYFDHIKHDSNKADLCEFWNNNINKYMQPIDYDIIVNVTTPDFYRFVEGKKVVAWTFWETSKFPQIKMGSGREGDWIKQINKLDEFWSPASFITDIAKKQGVNVPIKYLPWPCVSKYTNYRPDKVNINKISNIPDDKFVIGTVGQFTERKNFRDFVIALCSEFKNDEDVVGLIKTYRANDSANENNAVCSILTAWKKGLNIPDACSFYGVHSIISEEQMLALLSRIDLYVCTSHGEGMSGPLIHSMAMGKPVISSAFSAMSDFINTNTALQVIGHTLEPITGMSHIPWYGYGQEWARLNIEDIRNGMRLGYNMWKAERDTFKKVGERGRDFVRTKFSDEVVSNIIKELIYST